MLTVEGYFDGECVRITKSDELKKNQRVIVVFAEEFSKKKNNHSPLGEEERESVRKAIETDECVSSVSTNYDVDAYIRESRGYE